MTWGGVLFAHQSLIVFVNRDVSLCHRDSLQTAVGVTRYPRPGTTDAASRIFPSVAKSRVPNWCSFLVCFAWAGQFGQVRGTLKAPKND